MLARRIIPCLDVRDGRVVKGVRFQNHEDVGGIEELAQRYAHEGGIRACCCFSCVCF